MNRFVSVFRYVAIPIAVRTSGHTTRREPREPHYHPAPQITVNIFGAPSAKQTAIIHGAFDGRDGETSVGWK